MAPAVAARWMRQGMPTEVDAARAWLARPQVPGIGTHNRHRRRRQAGGAGGRCARGRPAVRTLAEERTRLFREQADQVALRNAIARKDYAPIQLLAQVLACASQAVSERFDHLPGALKKSCPEMTSAQRNEVVGVIVAARNEWVRATAELVAARLDELDDNGEPTKETP